MWLNDLTKATEAIIKHLGKNVNYVCVEKVFPCADRGIVFKTTYHTYIIWFPNGEIEERKEEEWRK